MAILKNVEPNPKKGDLHLEPCPFCGQKDPVYIQYETDVGPRWNPSADPRWNPSADPTERSKAAVQSAATPR